MRKLASPAENTCRFSAQQKETVTLILPKTISTFSIQVEITTYKQTCFVRLLSIEEQRIPTRIDNALVLLCAVQTQDDDITLEAHHISFSSTQTQSPRSVQAVGSEPFFIILYQFVRTSNESQDQPKVRCKTLHAIAHLCILWSRFWRPSPAITCSFLVGVILLRIFDFVALKKTQKPC